MNIFQRFSAVQKAMSQVGIDKSGTNQQQRYKYRGIDQVMNTLSPILAEHEVVLVPSVVTHGMTEGTTKNGGKSYHHTVEVDYTLYGPEGDSMGPFRSSGECIDMADKGLNKAQTAAYKYWVLTALCVPIEGQDDADATTPESYATINPEQQNELIALMMQTNTEAPEFLAWLNVRALPELAAEHFGKAKAALEKKLAIMSKEYAEGEAESAKSEGKA